jgi:peptidyl-prolyl cis-trans isomerase D
MLSYMRKHARSWFIKVLLGAVIVVFIFFYGFSLRERASALVAEVNGIKIAQRDFQKQFERLLELQRSRSSELTAEQRRLIKEATLETLIEQVLALEEADRWKIGVSQEELKEQVRQIPSFQEGGQFSVRRLQQYLRSRGQSEEEFMKELARELRIQKVEQLVRDGAWVSEEEVEIMYGLLQERVVLQYMAIPAEHYLKEIVPTEEEVRLHFKDHVAQYRIPEMVRVEYMRFEPGALLTRVDVTDKEIQELYDRNRDRWREDPQVLARQILIRSTEKDDDKTRMKALQKAEELLKKLKAGEDFGKLAKEHSQDPQTAGKGGSMGWKKRGELSEAVGKALFEEMKVGELSEKPVKSALGFHVLKLEEVRAERLRPLEEVRQEIEAEIRQNKARQMALELAEQAYLGVFQGQGFKEVAERLGAGLGTTEPFSLQGTLKEPPAGEPFRKAAFLLRENEDFSEVVEDGGSFYVIQLLERLPSRDPSLEEVQDRVRSDLQRTRGLERARQEAEAILARALKGETSLSAEAHRGGWKLLTSPSISRTSPPAAIPVEMAQAALSLGQGETLLPQPFKQGDRYLLGEIKERIQADPKGLEEQRPLLRALLLRDKREAMFRDWMNDLRSRSQIRTFRAYEEMF